MKLLLQFNPKLTLQEASIKAKDLYLKTKGKKVLNPARASDTAAKASGDFSEDSEDEDHSPEKVWEGGSESEMFNKLEDIARSPLPETPVLNSRITQTLEPKRVSKRVSIKGPGRTFSKFKQRYSTSMFYFIHTVVPRLLCPRDKSQI
jgi:DNA polymerase gamma 1